VYGGRPRFPPAPAEHLREALQAFRRQALHAARLELTHPETGALVIFESPLPDDMAALLEALQSDRDAAKTGR
jgi:23S rRNA pseudouridine1911/1915/1917 synthase